MRDGRTGPLGQLTVMGVGLEPGRPPPPRVTHGVLYLPLRLLGLPRGSHGCQPSAPPRPGPRRKPQAPPTLPRGGRHLREPSRARAAALRGPSFVPWGRPQFSQPRNRPSGARRQPGEAPPAPVPPSGVARGRESQDSPSPSPASASTAISDRCARPRGRAPGARRGRGRGRALGAALSSERAGVRGLTARALPEVA